MPTLKHHLMDKRLSHLQSVPILRDVGNVGTDVRPRLSESAVILFPFFLPTADSIVGYKAQRDGTLTVPWALTYNTKKVP
jgi:hypothetical protein